LFLEKVTLKFMPAEVFRFRRMMQGIDDRICDREGRGPLNDDIDHGEYFRGMNTSSIGRQEHCHRKPGKENWKKPTGL
jgi:hypothetical protein